MIGGNSHFPLGEALLQRRFSDLRAGYANPIVRSAHEMGSRRVSKKRGWSSLCYSILFFGETFDWMSELLAIFSISSDVGMLIGLSSKVRISLI